MNPTGIRDLLASERGAYAIAMAILSGALVYIGRMDIQLWTDFNQSIALTLIGSKTVTTGIELFTKRTQTPPATAPSANAPAPTPAPTPS